MGKIDYLLAFVGFTALASHQSKFLHALDERRGGVDAEFQFLADGVDRLFVFLPQYHQYELLRIGDSRRLEIGLIGLRDEAASRIKPKTQLVFEFQLVVCHVTKPLIELEN